MLCHAGSIGREDAIAARCINKKRRPLAHLERSKDPPSILYGTHAVGGWEEQNKEPNKQTTKSEQAKVRCHGRTNESTDKSPQVKQVGRNRWGSRLSVRQHVHRLNTGARLRGRGTQTRNMRAWGRSRRPIQEHICCLSLTHAHNTCCAMLEVSVVRTLLRQDVLTRSDAR